MTIASLFRCFGGGDRALPNVASAPRSRDTPAASGRPHAIAAPQIPLFVVAPQIWDFLSRPDKSALRQASREGRQVCDQLLECVLVADGAGAELLHQSSASADTRVDFALQAPGKSLQRLVSSGAQPSRVLISFGDGAESKRLSLGLAAIRALSAAHPTPDSELLHILLLGVPLSPDVVRALQSLLHLQPAPALATSTSPGVAASPSGKMLYAMPSGRFSIEGTAAVSSPKSTTDGALDKPSTILPPPLRIELIGEDFTKPASASSLESLVDSAAPRLEALTLRGCAGWPSRLVAHLQHCQRLKHLTVSFASLGPAAISYHMRLKKVSVLRQAGNPKAAAAAAQAAVAAANAASAVPNFPPAAGDAAAATAVRAVGGLKQLRSLELRGTSFHASSSAPCATPQVLTCALHSLTALTRLVLEGLPSVGPLLAARATGTTSTYPASMPNIAAASMASSVTSTTSTIAPPSARPSSSGYMPANNGPLAMLRILVLPDSGVTPEEMSALALATPKLAVLTLGALGRGPVAGIKDAAERSAAAKAAAHPVEALGLPPALHALRVLRSRPTLRTLRALRRTLDARTAASLAVAASHMGTMPSTAAAAVPRVTISVPGVELDMPEVEFDPLQALLHSGDGVMRSSFAPHSAEALAGVLRMLAAAAPHSSGGGSSSSDDDPASWQPIRRFVIHNDQGSLTATATETAGAEAESDSPPPSASVARQLAAASTGSGGADASDCGSGGGETVGARSTDPGIGATSADSEATDGTASGLKGHVAWIQALVHMPDLTDLELYGIGLQRPDLEALARVGSLRALSISACELEPEGLPLLAALPSLERLELIRCVPRATARDSTAGDGDRGRTNPGRSLLALCEAAPALKRLYLMRGVGAGGGGGPFGGGDGPLGAAWLQRQIEGGAVRGSGAPWPAVAWD
ncbi:hypothetical protein HYH03_006956 [Edaphochlamys debaryana]|uniref:Uncharacterized protein n=1 Tax=Edaphochlamys debaryana TaxID=47281 RepID=A0A836C104_9CHLO|nr:hypothetical protein HYH03_006956 [Edaphochlamys debaryana]|eukprot:KAG2495024.1 hypothetical protein HYH03_006956 [Edaphochlamys debaryana]